MKNKWLIAIALVLLVGCKQKDVPTSIYDFDITVSRIESHKVWLDLIPKDEFLSYYFDYISKEDWQYYGSDQAYLDELSSQNIEVLRGGIRQGAYLDVLWVRPNTEYYVLITAMSGLTPTQLRKVSFTSLPENINDFSVSKDEISMLGGTISINPIDDTKTYFWDYELKKEIDDAWDGFHSIWFYYTTEYYYQLDFLLPNPEDGLLSKGEDGEDIFSYYRADDVQIGDTLLVIVVGYDASGETSQAYMPFWIVYTGDESAAIDAEKDGFEDWYASINYSAKRALPKKCRIL